MALTPNLSLLRGYRPEDDLDERPPVITIFGTGPQRLFYINAEHVAGIENDTCRAIDRAFNEHNPLSVIIEGFATAWGESSPAYLDSARSYAASGFVQGGEAAYAACLAHERGIPFIGGEPTDHEVFLAMRQVGYSDEETGCFYTLRMIPQDRRERRANSEAEYLTLARDRFRRGFAQSPDGTHLTIEQFVAWYKAHRTDNRSFAEISHDDLAPYESSSATYFQRLSANIGRVREEHLVTIIAGAINRNDRVLVIYGDAHLVKSRAVLEDMMGSAEVLTPP